MKEHACGRCYVAGCHTTAIERAQVAPEDTCSSRLNHNDKLGNITEATQASTNQDEATKTALASYSLTSVMARSKQGRLGPRAPEQGVFRQAMRAPEIVKHSPCSTVLPKRTQRRNCTHPSRLKNLSAASSVTNLSVTSSREMRAALEAALPTSTSPIRVSGMTDGKRSVFSTTASPADARSCKVTRTATGPTESSPRKGADPQMTRTSPSTLRLGVRGSSKSGHRCYCHKARARTERP